MVAAADHDGARHLADELAAALPGNSVGAYWGVCFLSACVDAVRRASRVEDAGIEIERYAKSSIELIQRKGPRGLESLLQDPGCDGLRGRADFTAALSLDRSSQMD